MPAAIVVNTGQEGGSKWPELLELVNDVDCERDCHQSLWFGVVAARDSKRNARPEMGDPQERMRSWTRCGSRELCAKGRTVAVESCK